MLINSIADGLVLKVTMCRLRIWKLQFVVRLDADFPFLTIPVRECILAAYNGKCYGYLISQNAVIMPQVRIGFLQFLSLVSSEGHGNRGVGGVIVSYSYLSYPISLLR